MDEGSGLKERSGSPGWMDKSPGLSSVLVGRPSGPLSGFGPLARLPLRRGRPGRDELVADAADGSDHRLVLGAELGAQASYVHVDGAGAAEEVIPPDLLQELPAGADPTWPTRQEAQQLELLVGEVKRPPLESPRVGDRVDHQPPDPHGGVGVPRLRPPTLGEQADAR